MKHAQADYINAGYKYEKATSADRARAVAEGIRKMLNKEFPKLKIEIHHKELARSQKVFMSCLFPLPSQR